MYRTYSMEDPGIKKTFDQYMNARLRNQKLIDMGEAPEPRLTKLVRDIEAWAQSNFSPHDLNLMAEQVRIATPFHSDQIDQAVQDDMAREQKQREASQQEQLRQFNEFGNRALTQNIVKGGLSISEYDQLKRDGSITRKAPVVKSEAEINEANRKATSKHTKNGKGLDISSHIQAMDALEIATPEEYEAVLTRHGLIDSPELKGMVNRWKVDGLDQVRGAKASQQDDEVITLDERASRYMDVAKGYGENLDKDDIKDIFSEKFDPEFKEGGGDMREDLCNSFELNHTQEDEYSDILEAMR